MVTPRRSRIQLVLGQRELGEDDDARLRRAHDTRVRLGVPGYVVRAAYRLSRGHCKRGCTHSAVLPHAAVSGSE